MTFAVTSDPRCRPHVVVETKADGSVVGACGYRMYRRFRLVENVVGHRSVCRVCSTAGPVVYQALDREGNVLYVGRSKKVARRFATHEAHSPWWSRAVELRITRFDTELAAAREEAWLIAALRPPFNRQLEPLRIAAEDAAAARTG